MTWLDWLVLTVAGLITFSIRFSFFGLPAKWPLPTWLQRGLPYVPPAVFAAIILPGMLQPSGEIPVFVNPRFWAGLVAVLVAWRTHNMLATIAAGMIALWLLTLTGL